MEYDGESDTLVVFFRKGSAVVVLFSILALGCFLSRFEIRGIRLGTLGVLFPALAAGYAGYLVPREIMDLGLLLFVYSVGLQAGPRFFRTFRKQGLHFVIVGVAAVLAGTAVTLGLSAVMKFSPQLTIGLFTGGLSSTPAFAAAIDAFGRMGIKDCAEVAVGYGLTYPFGLIGVVLFVQFIPRLLKVDLDKEVENMRQRLEAEEPPLESKSYRVTNPNCIGKRVGELTIFSGSQANISRVFRSGLYIPFDPGFVLALGDVVTVVGGPNAMSVASILLGEETVVEMPLDGTIVANDIEVTEDYVAGKQLGELRLREKFGITITRIRRNAVEFIPKGKTTIEIGDQLVVVGRRENVQKLGETIGANVRRLDETNMFPFLAGLAFGIILGYVPFHLSSRIQFSLGPAGGAFLMSLVLSHFGGIGRQRLYVPQAAKNLLRELGQMLFFAGAGTAAGATGIRVAMESGPSLVLVGAAISLVAMVAAFITASVIFRMNVLSSMGSVCGAMTTASALPKPDPRLHTDVPALSYATVYPAVLILNIVIVQILVQIL